MPSYRRSLVWLLGIYFKRPWSLSHTLFFCQVFFFFVETIPAALYAIVLCIYGYVNTDLLYIEPIGLGLLTHTS